jgi:LTXXQ motif family protein
MDAIPENDPFRMENTMSFTIRSALVAIALASALTIAQAQTSQNQDHTVHHPDGQSAAPAKRPTMGPRGQQMMMRGESGGMMQMMRMMMTGGGMEGMAGRMAMMQPRHVEGRIAFLKTEIKITDQQSQQWNMFADALRQNAKTMMTMHEGMMESGTAASAPEMAEREIKVLSARLDAMKASAAAETALYAVLSEEQKKIGDELLSTPTMRM